jgi:hypothetical protein
MNLFFVNDMHRQNFESLEKNNQTKFEEYPATKAGAYVLAHPELYLTYESDVTKCLNGWSKCYEPNDSDQISNLWGLAEYLSGGFGDPFINEAIEVLNDENYKVFQQAMDLLRYEVRKVKADTA